MGAALAMLRDRVTPPASPPDVIALQALAHVMADDALAARFLSLSGLGADELRARAGDTALLAAVIDFLAAHEPDLVACARALGVAPATLAATARQLKAP